MDAAISNECHAGFLCIPKACDLIQKQFEAFLCLELEREADQYQYHLKLAYFQVSICKGPLCSRTLFLYLSCSWQMTGKTSSLFLLWNALLKPNQQE